jgi:alkyl hydroperoxide reductase subunit AhpC
MEESPIAKVASPAPKFSGEVYVDGKMEKLSSDELKGKWLLLFFYPLDFTFVCPTEITAYSDAMEDFKKRNTVVIGCSVDSVHSHKAWSEGSLGKINYPLLSDITKKISDDYGVLLEDGIALRGSFIIDPDGILKYSVVHDLNVGRSVEETLRVLDALQSGGLCAANWHKGEKFVEKR